MAALARFTVMAERGLPLELLGKAWDATITVYRNLYQSALGPMDFRHTAHELKLREIERADARVAMGELEVARAGLLKAMKHARATRVPVSCEKSGCKGGIGVETRLIQGDVVYLCKQHAYE